MRIIIRSGNETGREFDITHEMTAGRAVENEIVLSNADVSSYHARFVLTPGGVELTDSGSRNGTFVNGERLSGVVLLKAGDEIRFGNTVTASAMGETTSAGASPSAANTLVVRTGRDSGRSIPVPATGVITIGRDPSCDFVLSDPRVSSKHARITRTDSGLQVTDLGSANGTLVNGHQVAGTTSAGDGAEIQLGETVLIYYREARAGGFISQPTVVGSITPATAAAIEGRSKNRMRMAIIGGGAAAAVIGVAAIGGVLLTRGGGNGDLTVEELVELRRSAVVHILALDEFGNGGQGSGSVFDAEDGLIVTNNHVATGGSLYVLNENIKKPVDAKLIGAAPCEDLAVIQISRRGDRDSLTEVVFGTMADLRQGQTVVAMGFPASAESGTGERLDTLSTTSGIISKSDTVYDNRGDVPLLREAIQHQAAVNPGNSGGPLFDLKGRQIGVNTAIFFIDGRGRAEGENYAIGADRLQDVIEDLRDGKSPKWIGTSFGVVTNNAGEAAGLIIQGVTPGSPAEQADLRVDDIIIAIDGKEVYDLHSYCEAMPSREGESVTVTIITPDDEEFDVEVVVGTDD